MAIPRKPVTNTKSDVPKEQPLKKRRRADFSDSPQKIKRSESARKKENAPLGDPRNNADRKNNSSPSRPNNPNKKISERNVRKNRETTQKESTQNHRSLPPTSPELIKAYNKNPKSVTLEMMQQHLGEVEGFDIDDLNSTAALFLSKESRTPPDREEMKRLAEERKKIAARRRAERDEN